MSCHLSPRITNFLADRYKQGSPYGEAETKGFPSASATYPAFQKDLKGRIQVLGYIGHSFELGTPLTSVGITFAIKDPVFQIDAVIQHDSMNLFQQANWPTVKPEDVTQFDVTPRVVFIAACFTQTAFLKLWNITDNFTKGHALVIAQVRAGQGENLEDAATAYIALLDSLLQGNTIEQAKNDANKAIPNGAPFVVLGDHSVRLIKPKQ